MYSQYFDQNDWILLDEDAQKEEPPHRERLLSEDTPRQSSALLGEVSGGISQLLSSVSKHFSLEHFDTGDILLVLIILFLFLEGDNLELVIVLGLMLLLGLGDDHSDD